MHLTTEHQNTQGKKLIVLNREIYQSTIRVGALNSGLSILIDQEDRKLVRMKA